MGRFNWAGRGGSKCRGICLQDGCTPVLRAEACTPQMGTYNMATFYPELVTQIARQRAYSNAPHPLVPSCKRTALFQVAT